MSSQPTRRSRVAEQQIRLQKILDKEHLMRMESVRRRKIDFDVDGRINEEASYEHASQNVEKENDVELYQTHGGGSSSDVLDASGMESISHRCALLEEDIGKQSNFESMSKELQENQRRCFASLNVGYVQLWHSSKTFHGQDEDVSSGTLWCNRLDGLKVTLSAGSATNNVLIRAHNADSSSINTAAGDENANTQEMENSTTSGVIRIQPSHPAWNDLERAMRSVAIADYTSYSNNDSMNRKGALLPLGSDHVDPYYRQNWSSIIITSIPSFTDQGEGADSKANVRAILLAAESGNPHTFPLPSRNASRRVIQMNNFRLRALFACQCMSRLASKISSVVNAARVSEERRRILLQLKTVEHEQMVASQLESLRYSLGREDSVWALGSRILSLLDSLPPSPAFSGLGRVGNCECFRKNWWVVQSGGTLAYLSLGTNAGTPVAIEARERRHPIFRTLHRAPTPHQDEEKVSIENLSSDDLVKAGLVRSLEEAEQVCGHLAGHSVDTKDGAGSVTIVSCLLSKDTSIGQLGNYSIVLMTALSNTGQLHGQRGSSLHEISLAKRAAFVASDITSRAVSSTTSAQQRSIDSLSSTALVPIMNGHLLSSMTELEASSNDRILRHKALLETLCHASSLSSLGCSNVGLIAPGVSGPANKSPHAGNAVFLSLSEQTSSTLSVLVIPSLKVNRLVSSVERASSTSTNKTGLLLAERSALGETSDISISVLGLQARHLQEGVEDPGVDTGTLLEHEDLRPVLDQLRVTTALLIPLPADAYGTPLYVVLASPGVSPGSRHELVSSTVLDSRFSFASLTWMSVYVMSKLPTQLQQVGAVVKKHLDEIANQCRVRSTDRALVSIGSEIARRSMNQRVARCFNSWAAWARASTGNREQRLRDQLLGLASNLLHRSEQGHSHLSERGSTYGGFASEIRNALSDVFPLDLVDVSVADAFEAQTNITDGHSEDASTGSTNTDTTTISFERQQDAPAVAVLSRIVVNGRQGPVLARLNVLASVRRKLRYISFLGRSTREEDAFRPWEVQAVEAICNLGRTCFLGLSTIGRSVTLDKNQVLGSRTSAAVSAKDRKVCPPPADGDVNALVLPALATILPRLVDALTKAVVTPIKLDASDPPANNTDDDKNSNAGGASTASAEKTLLASTVPLVVRLVQRLSGAKVALLRLKHPASAGKETPDSLVSSEDWSDSLETSDESSLLSYLPFVASRDRYGGDGTDLIFSLEDPMHGAPIGKNSERSKGSGLRGEMRLRHGSTDSGGILEPFSGPQCQAAASLLYLLSASMSLLEAIDHNHREAHGLRLQLTELQGVLETAQIALNAGSSRLNLLHVQVKQSHVIRSFVTSLISAQQGIVPDKREIVSIMHKALIELLSAAISGDNEEGKITLGEVRSVLMLRVTEGDSDRYDEVPSWDEDSDDARDPLRLTAGQLSQFPLASLSALYSTTHSEEPMAASMRPFRVMLHSHSNVIIGAMLLFRGGAPGRSESFSSVVDPSNGTSSGPPIRPTVYPSYANVPEWDEVRELSSWLSLMLQVCLGALERHISQVQAEQLRSAVSSLQQQQGALLADIDSSQGDAMSLREVLEKERSLRKAEELTSTNKNHELQLQVDALIFEKGQLREEYELVQDRLRDSLTVSLNDHQALEQEQKQLRSRLDRVLSTLKGYILSVPASRGHYTKEGIMQWLVDCLDTRLADSSDKTDGGGIILYCLGQRHGGLLTGGGGVRGLLAAAGECVRTQESVEFITTIAPAVLFSEGDHEASRKAAASPGGKVGVLLLPNRCISRHHEHSCAVFCYYRRARSETSEYEGTVPRLSSIDSYFTEPEKEYLRVITDLAAYTMESAQCGPDSEAVAQMSRRDASLRRSVKMYKTLVQEYTRESAIVVPSHTADVRDGGNEASVSVAQYRSMLSYNLEKALVATLQPEGTTSDHICVLSSVYFVPWERGEVARAMNGGDFSAVYEIVQRVSGAASTAYNSGDSDTGMTSNALLDGELGLVQQCVAEGRPGVLGRVMWLPLYLPSSRLSHMGDHDISLASSKLAAVVRVERQPSLKAPVPRPSSVSSAIPISEANEKEVWDQLPFSREDIEACQDLLLLFSTKVELLSLSNDARGSVQEATGSIVSLQKQNKFLLGEIANEIARSALYRKTMQQGVDVLQAARAQRSSWGAQVDSACRVVRDITASTSVTILFPAGVGLLAVTDTGHHRAANASSTIDLIASSSALATDTSAPYYMLSPSSSLPVQVKLGTADAEYLSLTSGKPIYAVSRGNKVDIEGQHTSKNSGRFWVDIDEFWSVRSDNSTSSSAGSPKAALAIPFRLHSGFNEEGQIAPLTAVMCISRSSSASTSSVLAFDEDDAAAATHVATVLAHCLDVQSGSADGLTETRRRLHLLGKELFKANQAMKAMRRREGYCEEVLADLQAPTPLSSAERDGRIVGAGTTQDVLLWLARESFSSWSVALSSRSTFQERRLLSLRLDPIVGSGVAQDQELPVGKNHKDEEGDMECFDDEDDDAQTEAEKTTGEIPGPRMRRCRVRSPAGTVSGVVSVGVLQDTALEINVAVDVSGYPLSYLTISNRLSSDSGSQSSSISFSTTPLSEQLLAVRTRLALYLHHLRMHLSWSSQYKHSLMKESMLTRRVNSLQQLRMHAERCARGVKAAENDFSRDLRKATLSRRDLPITDQYILELVTRAVAKMKDISGIETRVLLIEGATARESDGTMTTTSNCSPSGPEAASIASRRSQVVCMHRLIDSAEPLQKACDAATEIMNGGDPEGIHVNGGPIASLYYPPGGSSNARALEHGDVYIPLIIHPRGLKLVIISSCRLHATNRSALLEDDDIEEGNAGTTKFEEGLSRESEAYFSTVILHSLHSLRDCLASALCTMDTLSNAQENSRKLGLRFVLSCRSHHRYRYLLRKAWCQLTLWAQHTSKVSSEKELLTTQTAVKRLEELHQDLIGWDTLQQRVLAAVNAGDGLSISSTMNHMEADAVSGSESITLSSCLSVWKKVSSPLVDMVGTITRRHHRIAAHSASAGENIPQLRGCGLIAPTHDRLVVHPLPASDEDPIAYDRSVASAHECRLVDYAVMGLSTYEGLPTTDSGMESHNHLDTGVPSFSEAGAVIVSRDAAELGSQIVSRLEHVLSSMKGSNVTTSTLEVAHVDGIIRLVRVVKAPESVSSASGQSLGERQHLWLVPVGARSEAGFQKNAAMSTVAVLRILMVEPSYVPFRPITKENHTKGGDESGWWTESLEMVENLAPSLRALHALFLRYAVTIAPFLTTSLAQQQLKALYLNSEENLRFAIKREGQLESQLTRNTWASRVSTAAMGVMGSFSTRLDALLPSVHDASGGGANSHLSESETDSTPLGLHLSPAGPLVHLISPLEAALGGAEITIYLLPSPAALESAKAIAKPGRSMSEAEAFLIELNALSDDSLDVSIQHRALHSLVMSKDAGLLAERGITDPMQGVRVTVIRSGGVNIPAQSRSSVLTSAAANDEAGEGSVRQYRQLRKEDDSPLGVLCLDFTRLAPTERQLWATAPSTLADAIAEGVTGVIVTMFTAHENIRKVRDADRNVDDLLAELHKGDSVVAQAKQDKIQSDFLCSFYGSLAQLQQDVVVYNSASPLLLSSQIDRRDRRNKKAHTSSLGEGEEADKEDEELPTLWQAERQRLSSLVISWCEKLPRLLRPEQILTEGQPAVGTLQQNDNTIKSNHPVNSIIFSVGQKRYDGDNETSTAYQQDKWQWFHPEGYSRLSPAATAIIDNVCQSALSRMRRAEVEISVPLSHDTNGGASSFGGDSVGLRVIIIPIMGMADSSNSPVEALGLNIAVTAPNNDKTSTIDTGADRYENEDTDSLLGVLQVLIPLSEEDPRGAGSFSDLPFEELCGTVIVSLSALFNIYRNKVALSEQVENLEEDVLALADKSSEYQSAVLTSSSCTMLWRALAILQTHISIAVSKGMTAIDALEGYCLDNEDGNYVTANGVRGPDEGTTSLDALADVMAKAGLSISFSALEDNNEGDDANYKGADVPAREKGPEGSQVRENVAVVLRLSRRDGAQTVLRVESEDDAMDVARRYLQRSENSTDISTERVKKLATLIETKRAEALRQSSNDYASLEEEEEEEEKKPRSDAMRGQRSARQKEGHGVRMIEPATIAGDSIDVSTNGEVNEKLSDPTFATSFPVPDLEVTCHASIQAFVEYSVACHALSMLRHMLVNSTRTSLSLAEAEEVLSAERNRRESAESLLVDKENILEGIKAVVGNGDRSNGKEKSVSMVPFMRHAVNRMESVTSVDLSHKHTPPTGVVDPIVSQMTVSAMPQTSLVIGTVLLLAERILSLHFPRPLSRSHYQRHRHRHSHHSLTGRGVRAAMAEKALNLGTIKDPQDTEDSYDQRPTPLGLGLYHLSVLLVRVEPEVNRSTNNVVASNIEISLMHHTYYTRNKGHTRANPEADEEAGFSPGGLFEDDHRLVMGDPRRYPFKTEKNDFMPLIGTNRAPQGSGDLELHANEGEDIQDNSSSEEDKSDSVLSENESDSDRSDIEGSVEDDSSQNGEGLTPPTDSALNQAIHLALKNASHGAGNSSRGSFTPGNSGVCTRVYDYTAARSMVSSVDPSAAYLKTPVTHENNATGDLHGVHASFIDHLAKPKANPDRTVDVTTDPSTNPRMVVCQCTVLPISVWSIDPAIGMQKQEGESLPVDRTQENAMGKKRGERERVRRVFIEEPADSSRIEGTPVPHQLTRARIGEWEENVPTTPGTGTNTRPYFIPVLRIIYGAPESEEIGRVSPPAADAVVAGWGVNWSTLSSLLQPSLQYCSSMALGLAKTRACALSAAAERELHRLRMARACQERDDWKAIEKDTRLLARASLSQSIASTGSTSPSITVTSSQGFTQSAKIHGSELRAGTSLRDSLPPMTMNLASRAAVHTMLANRCIHALSGILALTKSRAAGIVFTHFDPERRSEEMIEGSSLYATDPESAKPDRSDSTAELATQERMRRLLTPRKYRVIRIGNSGELDWPALLPDEHSNGAFRVMTMDETRSGADWGLGENREDTKGIGERTLSLLQTAMSTGEPVVVADATAHPSYMPRVDGTLAVGSSVLLLPLLVNSTQTSIHSSEGSASTTSIYSTNVRGGVTRVAKASSLPGDSLEAAKIGASQSMHFVPKSDVLAVVVVVRNEPPSTKLTSSEFTQKEVAAASAFATYMTVALAPIVEMENRLTYKDLDAVIERRVMEQRDKIEKEKRETQGTAKSEEEIDIGGGSLSPSVVEKGSAGEHGDGSSSSGDAYEGPTSSKAETPSSTQRRRRRRNIPPATRSLTRGTQGGTTSAQDVTATSRELPSRLLEPTALGRARLRAPESRRISTAAQSRRNATRTVRRQTGT